MEKKRECGDRMREDEYAVFTPLVFSAPGGIGKETTVAYKRLASRATCSEAKIRISYDFCVDAMHLIFCRDTSSCYGNKR